MAKIPEYNSQVGLQPNNIVDVNKSNFVNPYKDTSSFVGKLGEVARKFDEIDVLNKATKASNRLYSRLKDEELKASKEIIGSDTNINEFINSYSDSISKIVNEELETIPEGRQKRLLKEKFELTGYNSFANIRKTLRNNFIKEQRFDFYVGLEQTRQEYLQELDPDKRNYIIDRVKEQVKNNVSVGIFTPEQGNRILETVNYKWKTDVATYDAITNPDLYFEQRDKYGLASQDLVNLDRIAPKAKERIKKENEKNIRDNQIKNEVSYISRFLEQGLSGDDILNIMDDILTRNISRDFGQAVLSVYNNKEEALSAKEEMALIKKGYVKNISNILSAEDKDMLMLGITNLLKDTSDGKITFNEMKELVKVAIDKHLMSLEKGDGWIDKAKSAFKSLVNTIKGFFGEDKNKNNNNLLLNFNKNLLKEDEPENALKKTLIDHYKSVNPNLSNIPKEGIIMTDAYGNKARVFPDGTVIEVSQ